MPTLPELLDRLADDGGNAGFDTVFTRAIAALDVHADVVEMSSRRSRRRVGWIAVTAIATAAAIAVPLIVTRATGRERKPARVSVPPRPHDSGVRPNVRSATAAELTTWKWT